MGSFRRRIEITTRPTGADAGEARAAVEDDFHHFRVIIRHDGEQILSADAQTLRQPFSTCSAASSQLSQLTGMRLKTAFIDIFSQINQRTHCTHMIDLAGLACHTATGAVRHIAFDIEVPDRDADGHTQVRLKQNATPVLTWSIDRDTILQPAPFSGVSYRRGFARWVFTNLPLNEAQQALIMRRCAMICVGRTRDLDAIIHAEPTGLCYAQQSERAARGARVIGSSHDFTHSADALCAEDKDWLSALLA